MMKAGMPDLHRSPTDSNSDVVYVVDPKLEVLSVGHHSCHINILTAIGWKDRCLGCFGSDHLSKLQLSTMFSACLALQKNKSVHTNPRGAAHKGRWPMLKYPNPRGLSHFTDGARVSGKSEIAGDGAMGVK